MFSAVLLVLVVGVAAEAQIPGISSPSPTSPPVPVDILGRETPRGTVMGFLRAAQDENYPVAIQYFQRPAGRHRPTADEEQDLAAELLAVINQKILASSLDGLSRDPQGHLDDGLPADQEIVAGVHDSSAFNILLVRTDDDRGNKIWLFSRQTLEAVPEVYDALQFSGIERRLPSYLTRNRFIYMPLWQWLAIILALPLALALASIAVLFLRLGRRYYRMARGKPVTPVRLFHVGPGTLLLAAFAHYLFVFMIGASIVYRQYYRRVLWIFFAVAACWMVARVTREVSTLAIRRLTASGRMGERSVVSLARRVFNILAFIVIGLIALSTLGVNVTAALAGLGIGGLAIGLGAQKTFENLLGGISIITDRVLQIGDACRIGDQRGTVEDIGLRSTRLRTEDRTVVTIPNGTVANVVLENLRQRDKILCRQTVRLRYDLAPDHIRYSLEEIRSVLKHNEHVEDSTSRVRLLRFAEWAIEVEIYAYILVRDFPEFLAIQEQLLLDVVDSIERTGAAVALPSQATLVTKDAWIDPEKERAAKAAIGKDRDPGGKAMPAP
jgi:MscS family membrane protein